MATYDPSAEIAASRRMSKIHFLMAALFLVTGFIGWRISINEGMFYRPAGVTTVTGPRTGAICEDGTMSDATGQGACSYHGGVWQWLQTKREVAVPAAGSPPPTGLSKVAADFNWGLFLIGAFFVYKGVSASASARELERRLRDEAKRGLDAPYVARLERGNGPTGNQPKPSPPAKREWAPRIFLCSGCRREFREPEGGFPSCPYCNAPFNWDGFSSGRVRDVAAGEDPWQDFE